MAGDVSVISITLYIARSCGKMRGWHATFLLQRFYSTVATKSAKNDILIVSFIKVIRDKREEMKKER